MSEETADGVVIDRAANTIRLSRSYAAGVERVWWAWTDAEAITQWWGPRGWRATVYEMDVRPGGRWRFQIAPVDGSADPVRGIATYRTVVAGVELGYEDVFADESWQPEGPDTYPTEVTFTANGTGCTVGVTASFPDGDALRRAVELHMAEGYAEALDRLGGVVDHP